MIAVRETSSGVFEPIEGNPVLTSTHPDEDQRHCTPLATLFGENWTDQMRKAIRQLGLKATVDGYVSTVSEEKREAGNMLSRSPGATGW